MRVLAVVVLLAGSGCATILAPGPDLVLVESDPPGAEVLIDGRPAGRTPAQVMVLRNEEARLTLRKDGYQDVQYDYDKDINPPTLANLLLGGLLGFIVDAASQNIGKYDPGPLRFRMYPVMRPPAENDLDDPDVKDRLPLPGEEEAIRKAKELRRQRLSGRKPCPAKDPELEKLRPPGYVSPDEANCIPADKPKDEQYDDERDDGGDWR
jgi:hypothetical protein